MTLSPGHRLRPDALRRAVLIHILLVGALYGGTDPKSATATRISMPPRIDGRLDEPAWQQAAPAVEFIQHDPNDGAPASQRTEVRFLYDDDALYIGATMYDTDAQHIVARLARRDVEVESDNISVRLDMYHDHQTDYEFTVNAAGAKTDILEYDDGSHVDVSWDAVWDVQTTVAGDRWVAEFRIPFSMLRFRDEDKQTWGLQIIRHISRLQESQYWVRIPKSESGWASKFGHLTGITRVPHHAALELLPYGLAGVSALADRPGKAEEHRNDLNAGLDLKYRPSASMTIDATFNPDFGQVEADPSVLNLSTIETFYPEKRPFFIEGVQILKFTSFGDEAGPGLFYSRRIGHSLSVAPPVGGYVETEPRSSTILGAAKISGKTAGGLSIGVLEAVTDREEATVVDSNGAHQHPLIEPISNYALVRLKQDFGGNSNVGMIVTSTNRNDRVPALTGGLDWNVRFADNLYRLDGFFAHSRTTLRGFPEEGGAGRATLEKRGGPHWRGSFTADFTAKGYDINDIGFFRRPNDHGFVTQVQYRDDEVRESERFWNVILFNHLRWNFDHANLFNTWMLTGSITLPSYWQVQVSGNMDDGLYDDRETRGFGLFRKAGTRTAQVVVVSDPRGLVVAQIAAQGFADTRQARGWQGRVTIDFKPTTALTFQVEASSNRTNRQFAWATNVTDAAMSPSYFPVFANRTTRTWDLTTRGAFIFTTDLTLQWYAQWFTAQGTYADPQARLDVDAYAPYGGVTIPDFTSLQFNSNIVLRWEYLPGSTLYLVWSHARVGSGGTFFRTVPDNLGDTFRVPPDNVVLLKISYWLST